MSLNKVISYNSFYTQFVHIWDKLRKAELYKANVILPDKVIIGMKALKWWLLIQQEHEYLQLTSMILT